MWSSDWSDDFVAMLPDETPCTSTEKLRQEDTGTSEYTKTVEIDISSPLDTNKQVNTDKKKKSPKKRKRRTRQKLKYIYTSSSDDDIPLQHLADKLTNAHDCESDDTYKPSQHDLTSSDSECNRGKSRKANTSRIQLLKIIRAKSVKKAKQVCISKQRSKLCRKKGINQENKESVRQTDYHRTSIMNIIEQIKTHSEQENDRQNDIIAIHTARIDVLLNNRGLARKEIAAHGNCFFEAVVYSKLVRYTHSELREHLCQHLEDNMEEYMGFFIDQNNPESEEEFVIQYLSEIEYLKKDGYWSNTVADFLPLVLSNFLKLRIEIYTSQENQPVIKIEPTMSPKPAINSAPIQIAYLSIPGVLEHFDACEPLVGRSGDGMEKSEQCSVQNTSNNAEYVATKVVLDTNIPTIPVEHNETNGQQQHTPRKKAVYNTPIRKKLTRKRKLTPENWKKNIRKNLRMRGQEYVSSSGKTVQARCVKETLCTKCKYNCSEKISRTQQQKICETFWSLSTYERKKDFICSRVKEKKTRTYLDDSGNVVPKRKNVSRKYSFEIENVTVRVCKSFYMATIAVGSSFIDNAMKGKEDGCFKGTDKRGKHVPYNKTSSDQKQFVKEHINSFPKVAGHYTRKDTNREFLGPELSVSKMYQLYKESCIEKAIDPVKLSMYRKIFNENFNLSFHIPKKDQCNTCTQYYNAEAQGTLSTDQKEAYTKHQQRKVQAREEKQKDKSTAKENQKIHVATFDLQSVLYTPCSLVSLMYYMRKLCFYNLSLYSLGNGKGSCYVWSEIDGNRGSSEISTCLWLYLQALPSTVEHVVLYSDACCGQNRNTITAACLLHAVSTLDNIKVIDHKFLESGHTHMEVDSMHSAIEFAKRKTQIFVPSQWDTVLQMARRKDPYTVIPLKFHDIVNFKEIANKNIKKSEKGIKINWNKVKWLRYTKAESEVCYFKYDFESEFQKIRLVCSKRKQIHPKGEQMPRRYTQKLPISKAKKKDLVSLCQSGAIPNEYHEFYKTLPSSKDTRDRLPQPDATESGDSDLD